jgi:hypothetical protein
VSNKIKIQGYSKRVGLGNDVFYRNFSDNIVGNQFAEGDSLLTNNSFITKSVFSSKQNKFFNKSFFSQYYTLNQLTNSNNFETDFLNNININFNRENLFSFAYFGSLRELLRVSIEHIIKNYPASIYVFNESDFGNPLNTVENYIYNPITNEATFNVNVNRFVNNFNIKYSINQPSNEIELRNLNTNFTKYSLLVNNEEYNVLNYIPANNQSNDFSTIKVKGNPFQSSNQSIAYHIKPNKVYEELFYSNLDNFQSTLLNRNSNPKFTSFFRTKIVNQQGIFVNKDYFFTWTTSDGYNIDIEGVSYENYLNGLIELCEKQDEERSDIIIRRLVDEVLLEFDTFNIDSQVDFNFNGEKFSKLLRIYGRSFDNIKFKADGIQYANSYSYDKKNNAPDLLIKDFANLIGWIPNNNIFSNNIVDDYLDITITNTGYTKNYSIKEIDSEFWRRLIINSAWLWRSKGSRKAIEFIIKFIGLPDGLVQLNEYVYVAKDKIQKDIIDKIINQLDISINLINIDNNGYPFFKGFNGEYFQSKGGWYRETAGLNSIVDVLSGNNPHIGPYDGGSTYINSFKCLIPEFSAVTLQSTSTIFTEVNLYDNYNNGTVDNYSGSTFITLSDEDCLEIESNIIENPKPKDFETLCGCDDDTIVDSAIKINIKPKVNINTIDDCGITGFSLQEDGFVEFNINNELTTIVDPECCSAFNFTPVLSQNVFKCKWKNIEPCDLFVDVAIQSDGKVLFNNNGETTTVVPSENCCSNLSYPTNAVPTDGGFFCVVITPTDTENGVIQNETSRITGEYNIIRSVAKSENLKFNN